MPWSMGVAFEARTPIAKFMLRLREAALEAQFPSSNSDHDQGERRWKRAFSPSIKNNYLAGEALGPAAGTTPLESSTDGIGARGLLTETICALFLERLSTEHEQLPSAPPTVLSRVPYCRRAVDCRYGMC